MAPFPDLFILDLEASPSGQRATSNRLTTRDRSHISRSVIGVASILAISEEGKKATLRTLEGEEAAILAEIDDLLLKGQDHLLVTFNGTHFDLPLLRVRALVNHLFGLRAIGSIWNRPHQDVMKLFPGPLSLSGCSELLGLDIDERVMTRRQKCEADVVRTYLVWLHFTALTHGDGSVLLQGWRTLASDLSGPSLAHLVPLFDGLE